MPDPTRPFQYAHGPLLRASYNTTTTTTTTTTTATATAIATTTTTTTATITTTSTTNNNDNHHTNKWNSGEERWHSFKRCDARAVRLTGVCEK